MKYNMSVGSKIGRWKVVGFSGIKKGHHFYSCICECGKKRLVRKDSLLSGGTNSCGCLAKELSSKLGKAQIKHGFSSSDFYKRWSSIKSRCHQTKNPNYFLYGGRGIKCLWNSFEEFRDDMYSSYLVHSKINSGRKISIDRIDNNGHYCKENCRWATQKEQMRNQSRNVFITIDGVTKPMVDWANQLGIRYNTVVCRRHKGWPIERLFYGSKVQISKNLKYFCPPKK